MELHTTVHTKSKEYLYGERKKELERAAQTLPTFSAGVKWVCLLECRFLKVTEAVGHNVIILRLEFTQLSTQLSATLT